MTIPAKPKPKYPEDGVSAFVNFWSCVPLEASKMYTAPLPCPGYHNDISEDSHSFAKAIAIFPISCCEFVCTTYVQQIILHRALKCVMEFFSESIIQSSHLFGLLLRHKICLNTVWVASTLPSLRLRKRAVVDQSGSLGSSSQPDRPN